MAWIVPYESAETSLNVRVAFTGPLYNCQPSDTWQYVSLKLGSQSYAHNHGCSVLRPSFWA